MGCFLLEAGSVGQSGLKYIPMGPEPQHVRGLGSQERLMVVQTLQMAGESRGVRLRNQFQFNLLK